jgi:hypothetical protein
VASTTKASQQTLSERFLIFPAELFKRVFKDLLPQLQQNWQQRNKRPLLDSIASQPFLVSDK